MCRPVLLTDDTQRRLPHRAGSQAASAAEMGVRNMKRWMSVLVVLLAGLVVASGLTSATASPQLPKAKVTKVLAFGPPPSAIPNLEAVYVPIKPCRAADTRLSSAGILRHGSTRPLYVRGSAGFAGQGGTSSGCGIPAAATGVTVNATVTGESASGYMTNYPAGTTVPLSNFVSYHKSDTLSANPTFTLATGGVEPSVQIRTSTAANAHLIIDVTGYYMPQIQALVNPTGSIYAGSPRVLSVAKVATGYFQVAIDTNVNYCTPMVHPYYANEYATATTVSGTSVYVHVWYLDPSSHAETPVDDYFYLSVSC